MIYLSIIIFTIFVDQYSKYLISAHLAPIGYYALIPNILRLTYTENRGAAFSLFSDMQIFLILSTSIFIVILIFFLIRIPKSKENRWVNLSIALIIGGAFGNLIDRICLDYVIDFLDFQLINFAIFNFADCFVVCGSISLVLALLKNKDFLDDNPLKNKP